MKIGWTNRNYNVERMIVNKVLGAEYVHSHSYAACVSQMLDSVHVPRRGGLYFGASYIGGTADHRVDLFHFFNLLGCGLCKKTYVTTFETSVPRGLKPEDYWFKRGLESIMSDQCRKMLALSDCAKRIQMSALRPILSDSDMVLLERKIEVLHPPQKVFRQSDELWAKMSRGNSLKAVFVGSDFFRKGGGEILRAFIRLRKEYPVDLWIIGDLTRHGYACYPRLDDTDLHLRLIKENKGWIHWHPALSNTKVLELMRTCDIGLLPTRADTYGYSVLEMQSCGLPVVTTDVRALPEINDDDCGWVIRGCGKRDGMGVWGEADYSTPDKLVELSQRIERGVYEKVAEAIVNRETVVRKGMASLARVVAEHDPQNYGSRLSVIYRDALS